MFDYIPIPEPTATSPMVRDTPSFSNRDPKIVPLKKDCNELCVAIGLHFISEKTVFMPYFSTFDNLWMFLLPSVKIFGSNTGKDYATFVICLQL